MPWKAVRQLDVGTGTPVEPGEIIPTKVAEGIGMPDDAAHRSSFIDAGYVRWTDEAAPRAQPKRKGTNVPDENGEPTVDEQDPAQLDSAAGGNHEGTSVGAETAARQVERPDSEKAIAQRAKAEKSSAKKSSAKKSTSRKRS